MKQSHQHPLEILYHAGIPVCPPDGEYRIIINNIHTLTKKIYHGEGQNFLPWYRKPLFPWNWFSERFNLPTGDFTLKHDELLECCIIEYRDGKTFDYIKQVQGKINTWVGLLMINGRNICWFLMEKI